MLKDCGEEEKDEDEDSSNMSFGPWLRVGPMRTRIFARREEGRNKNYQKMIFKPIQKN